MRVYGLAMRRRAFALMRSVVRTHFTARSSLPPSSPAPSPQGRRGGTERQRKSEKRAVDLVKEFAQLPIAAVLYTDIERDGTEVGPNIAETARLARETGVAVIASGGVGTLEHLRALAAVEAGIVGAIVGRALLEGRFSIEEGKLAASSGAG